ncbi:hypothetical protein SAMN06298226_2827 [Nitrosovibrio sp. Nv4]|nr:hypothetical protein SAMN06298226_2827 [Nitrosovibrio sp. Nv4]
MQRRIRNGLGNDDGDKCRRNFNTDGSRYDQGSREEKGLVLPGRVETHMGRGIQMIVVVYCCMLMGLKVSRRIERENMMFVIELVSKYFAIKRPAKSIRHHTDEQYKHDGISMATLVHGVQIVSPQEE